MASDLVWRAVADPTRRRLIELLRDGPKTTGGLCRAFPTSRFAVMKHLAVLERCGVVTVRRAGRTRWNSLDPEPLRALDGRWPGAEGASRPEAAVVGSGSGSGPGAGTAAAGEVPGTVPGGAPGGPGTPVGQGVGPAWVATIQVYIDAAPWRVFDALTVNLAAWWGAPHLLAPDASNLILEPQPGGRFYEEWGHRQGALRGVVSAIRQDERLEVTGAIFGPTAASLCFRLERREGGTLLAASLATASHAAGPASGQDGRAILDDLVRTRLKAFVEAGTRSGLAV